MSIDEINSQFNNKIKEQLKKSTFDIWFKDIFISKSDLSNKTIYISVPNDFTKKILTNSYDSVVKKTLCDVLNCRDLSVEYQDINSKNSVSPVKTLKLDQLLQNTNLNPKYSFDDFVIGENNRFAHAACLAAAENNSKLYNPLFIYGGVGLGKTHLMHAVGHRYLELNPEAKVLYVSSETFTNEMINAIASKKVQSFRNKYRNINLLLIDDIQFLQGKEKTQDEFFHTFNELKNNDSQIVISCDESPQKLNIEKRLSSRFSWGLITDISKPDLETRIAILRKKAFHDNIEFPNEVYSIMAERITSNIRELEGALLRIDAFVEINKLDRNTLNEEEINTILKDITVNNISVNVNHENIKKAVAKFYGITIDEINSRRRTRNISFPRQIAMYMIRDMTDLSLPKIGKVFGGKDHTTVMHACDKISILVKTSPEVKQTLSQIKDLLETGKF